MAKRKQTPDVLAEILGGELPNGDLPTAAHKGSRPARTSAAEALDGGPQQWEYQLVSFQDYKGWRPRYLDGQELRDWTSGPLIHQYLEQMGEAGWELAAAAAGERLYGSADTHQLYFKRPK
jgi:hypothetical protein